ncbi:hypothetical protein AB0F91_14810 [Amycolatopsis sp. NPDC023774]|uniref:hypothetical protein n=1 Tax=Amycolatopsis sp. NPDC023774 TaxID=3155015 RepID=UPI0033DF9F90
MDLSLVRRGTGASGTTLDKQTVGNALVVHPATGMTDEAQALALGVAADTEHDLVVVDLPVDSPISLWESVAKVLPRRRRGVRLVIGGRSRETSALAGQWLSERINRTVLAPDGSVIPSAGGALFVHSGRGSGWVKFQPGRAPKWEAKRFPRPSWDSGLTAELTSTSSRGVAEPLPGGLWVRPVGFDQGQRAHRAALVKGLPAQHDTMTIVLGCPGCPPLTLDDAARLWVRLPENVRANARFVQYGPMSVPAGTTLGQALADLLGKEVAFYTGLPVGSPQLVDVRTVLFDGRLGWTTFVREIGYQPRVQGGPVQAPRLLSHRAPIHGLNEVAPAVYWYSPDAVIEVVQSGLLVRSPHDGRDTPAVRALMLDNSINNLTFDAASEAAVDRMRMLAQDVLARLDENTRRMSRVLPAHALLAERGRVQVTTKALAEIEQGDAAPAPALLEAAPTEVVVPGEYKPAAPVDLEVDVTPEPALLRSEPTITQRLDPGVGVPRSLAGVGSPVTITTARPQMVPVGEPSGGPFGDAQGDKPAGRQTEQPGGAGFAGPAGPTVPQGGAEVPAALAGPSAPSKFAAPEGGAEVPAAPAGPSAPPKFGVPGGFAGSGVPVPGAPTGFAGPATPIPPVAPPVGMPPAPVAPPSPAAVPVSMPPVATPPVGMPPAATPPAGVPPAATPPAGMPPAATPPAGMPPVAEVPPVAPPSVEAPTVQGPVVPVESTETTETTEITGAAETAENAQAGQNAPTTEAAAEPVVPAEQGEARLQPTPGAEATALLPKRGAEKEREWLRKSLGAEYGLMSNAVARILSEHPGFQGALSTSSAEVLTDAVAVQLYLSAKGAAIDGALRTGANGPHVPIARCVVAGLSRLPSHRGPATFATSVSKSEWDLFRSRKVLTEWGFLNTLTQPSSTLAGDTDVLVWSITARRTKLLEPTAGGVENRVLFVPGTSFKVLDLREPAEGVRGLVLLRELTSSEVDETGKVASDRISLDELALVSLRRELEVWAEAEGRDPIAEVSAPRFGALPGLV